MPFDIPTIVFVTSIIFTTLAIAVFVHYQVDSSVHGFGWWLTGAVLHAAGFFLMLTLRNPSLIALTMLANPLVFAGEWALNLGIRKFLGMGAARRESAAVFAAFILVYFYFIFIRNSISGRSVVVSASFALISGRIAYTLLKNKRPHFSGSAFFLASVFLIYGALHLAVAVKTLFSPALLSYRDLVQEPLRVALFIVPIVCGTLWTFGFIIMANERLNAENKKEREKLRTSEREVRQLLNEKDILLKEVHHRIKNNMGTISSLLSLQASLSKESATINALKDAGNRLQSMTTLYEELYRSTKFTALSLQDYLPQLIDEILSNFPASARVNVEKRIDDIVLEVRTLQPLGIIINELLTNIMKHAFPSGGVDEITVSAQLSGNRVSVVVEDNGKGMNEAAVFNNDEEFGLMIVGALTRQLRGTIRTERAEGTRIHLEFDK